MNNSNTKINYIYNVAYQILNVLMPIATAPYVARTIGADGVGIGSYYSTVAGYFATFAMLGLTNYGSRTIAQCGERRHEQNKVFSSLFYMQIIMCVIMGLLYTGYIFLFIKANIAMASLYGLTIVASAINLNWYFWGIEEFKITVTRSFVVKIVTFISIFVMVKDTNDVLLYNAILVIGNFLGNMPLIIIAPKYVKLVSVSFRDVWRNFKPNVMLFIPIIGATLYRTVDKVMIGLMINFQEVGFYENADKIINICLGCIIALGQVMMPRSSNLLSTGKIDESKRLLEKSFRFSSLFSSAITFGLLSVSSIFIPIFLGDNFEDSASILSILSLSFLFLAWGNVLKTQVIIAGEKDDIYIKATFLGLIINFSLNSILIPIMKGDGAAIATVITEGCVFIYLAFKIKQDISVGKMLKQSFPYLAVGFVMMIIVFIIRIQLDINIFSLIILICIGGVIFIIGCLILAFGFKDDLLLDMINIVLKRKM